LTMQELTIKCPLTNQEHTTHGHGDKCCKIVGCGICENHFCQIGNPNARQLAFWGFMCLSSHNIILGYTPMLEKSKQGKMIYDPREKGIIPDGYIENGKLHSFEHRLIKECKTVEEAKTFAKIWSSDKDDIILGSTNANDNGLYPVFVIEGLTKEDTDILNKAWGIPQKSD